MPAFIGAVGETISWLAVLAHSEEE